MEDKAHFAQLFRQYYPILCRFAHGYVRESMVVEEIIDDVFVKYWACRSQIAIHSSLKEYLFKATKNACIDYLRAVQKHRHHTAYIDEQEIVCNTLADLDEDPLDYIISQETEQHLMQAIDELPARYRLTFTLSRIDGLNYDEIAKTMSITKNTVKSNLRDAMALLRGKLKDLIVLLLLFFEM